MKKGFTLIEILAVVIILAIIMLISIPAVNKTIENRKKDSLFLAAKSIVRDVEYDKLTDSGFNYAYLDDLNLSGITESNYDLEKSIVYVEDDIFKIDLVGKGKFKGLYACGIAKNSKQINVGDTPCEGPGGIETELIAFGTNGSTTYGKSKNTVVNVNITNLNASSLKYLWTTSTIAPAEGSFSTSFTNGQTINTPAGVSGSYYLWILAKDMSNVTTILSSKVFNLDNTAPVITINGSASITINVGDTYSDAGATATDNVDTISSVNVADTVNTSVAGTYTVTYTVSDSSGNAATPVVRTVVVASSNYAASKGVNKPRLTTGMVPIKWNGSAWVDTTESDSDWYNYTVADKKWANARTSDCTNPSDPATCSMWVWIPRYAYQIASNYHTATTGTINIKFLKDTTNTASDNSTVATTPAYSGSNQTNYVLHPAFNFGGTQITGIWVAKFEPSVSDQSSSCYTSGGANCNLTSLIPKIIPNVKSWRDQDVGVAFTVSRNMEASGNPYGWSANQVDTHMMKNTEWGMIAYLSQSTYGKNSRIWINPNSNYLTGCAGTAVGSSSTTTCNQYSDLTYGVNASSTGNVYGIYDLAGGAWERPAGYIDNGSSDITTYTSIYNANWRYKDVYPKGSTDTADTNYSVSNAIVGDAVWETSSTAANYTSWNSEYSRMPYSSTAWFYRGGDNTYTTAAGIFCFRYVEGARSDNRTFRPVVIVDSTLN